MFSRFCALTLFPLNTLAIWLHSLKLFSNLKVFEHWNPVIQQNRTIFFHETLIAIEDTKPRNMKPYTEKWDRDRNLRRQKNTFKNNLKKRVLVKSKTKKIFGKMVT